jgi:O-antigen ligase
MIRLRLDPVIWFINVAVMFYILAVFLVSSMPGLSRLAHLGVVLIVLGLLLVGWRRGLRLRLDGLMFVFLAFGVFAYLSIFWAGNSSGAAVSAVGLAVNIIGAVGVWVGLWNGVKLESIGYAALIGASVQAVTALNQFLAGEFSAGAFLRAEGLTGNANALTIQLSLAAFVVLITLRRFRWAPVMAVLLVVVATIVSGSRKVAFVWFALALLLLQYISARLHTSTLFRLAFLFCLPLAVFLVFTYRDVIFEPIQNLYVYERFQGAIDGTESSANVRSAMIEQGLALWRDSPVYGYGIEQFRHLSSFNTYSHNNYVELLVSFGVIGFALYYGVLLIIFLRSLIGFRQRSPYAALSFGAIVLLLLWDVAMVSYSGRLNWLFLGVLGYLSSLNLRPEPAAETAELPAPTLPQRSLRAF